MEIPAGEECFGEWRNGIPHSKCVFCFIEQDTYYEPSCSLFKGTTLKTTDAPRFSEERIYRCKQCILDHPHGAVITIHNKEENPVTVKVVIHEGEDELTTHGGPNEAVTMYETFECQMFVPEGEYYLVPKK